jgi:hypothetical protein
VNLNELSAHELWREMMVAKADIDLAHDEYRRAIEEDANADRAARLAYASAYIAASGTVGEREAHAEQAAADPKYRARLAEGIKRSAASAVESRRQWLSALQSAASAYRSEAQLAKWEPREVSQP